MHKILEELFCNLLINVWFSTEELINSEKISNNKRENKYRMFETKSIIKSGRKLFFENVLITLQHPNISKKIFDF